MSTSIKISKDELVDALTTASTIKSAAAELGVSYGWLYYQAKQLEKEGLIVPRAQLPIYIKKEDVI